MTGVLMFLALAIFVVCVCVYGWWNDPHVRFERKKREFLRAIERMNAQVGERLIPAFDAMVPALRAASEACAAFNDAFSDPRFFKGVSE